VISERSKDLAAIIGKITRLDVPSRYYKNIEWLGKRAAVLPEYLANSTLDAITNCGAFLDLCRHCYRDPALCLQGGRNNDQEVLRIQLLADISEARDLGGSSQASLRSEGEALSDSDPCEVR
jgi:hypothetical protein